MLYNKLHLHIDELFLGYAVICAVLGVLCFIILNPAPIPAVTTDSSAQVTDEKVPPFLAEIKSKKLDLIVLCAFVCFNVLRYAFISADFFGLILNSSTYFYFGTANEQLLWISGNNKKKAAEMAEVFAILIPTIGIVVLFPIFVGSNT